ncbi:hypothetical protein [Psychroflexus montanilacus]|uniref:hypothetical protein n=1 Tax=Psychroflexus montanilacus TaxID=2873598 RepID=UPI001CC9DCFA|nr:hypothetical protein [Psychroflexus montanilacus]MBZ9651820.1 hypothetical protein [Psychroflexus montanilacus]
MEINLGSIIIGAIIITICILPIVMLRRSRKKRESVLLQSLSEIATQNNCQINQYEILGSLAIGIDKTQNFVFFYRQIENNETKEFVNLDEIQSCNVINTGKSLNNKNENQKEIDRLELSFIPTSINKSEIKMEFFNSDINVQLYGELQLIEKWSIIINDRLKHKS